MQKLKQSRLSEFSHREASKANKLILIAKDFASRYQFPMGLFALARAEITVTGKICTLKNCGWIFVRGESFREKSRRLTDVGEKVTCLTWRDL